MQDWWQSIFPQGRQTLWIRDANGIDVSIAYGELGTGVPLVLVHGIASWSYAWRYNIQPLAEHFRVICFDAKGSGFSEKPLRPDHADHKVLELEQVLRALCNQPAILVAESLGALVALALAQAHPELIDRLVLMNVPIFPTKLPNLGMRLLAEMPLEWVRLVDHLRLPERFSPLIRPMVYALRAEVSANPNQITPDDVYWMTYPHIAFPGTITKLAEEFHRSAEEIRSLHQGQPNLIASIHAHLAQVTCSTLILWADRDRWFPVAHGEMLRDRLPNAQFQVIPNCGHYAAGGQPEFINAAILAFLQQSYPYRG
jgi:pimeloyl-ACP methyl ester carboxylesterase